MESSATVSIKDQFLAMKTREDVAVILGIKEKSLRYFLFKKRPENMYHTFDIPKKNGKSRKISAPSRELKEIQKKLALILTFIYEPKVCAYGFINNKSFVDNATQHTKRNLILNIDLKDFFTQIHFGRIRGMLMNAPYSIGEEAATTIAQIACFNGVLPQGAPTSPILTNMICVPLDNSLMRLAKRTGCTYSRYADDITFSTHKKAFDESLIYIERDKVCIGQKLLSILERHSFTVNPEKITLRSWHSRQEVTGLTVNAFPNLRRSYIKQFRAILHHCEKHGIYKTAQEYVTKGYCRNQDIKKIINDHEKEEIVDGWFKKVLIGKMNFFKQVRGNDSLTYLSFAQKINNIFGEAIFDVSALNLLADLISHNTYVLEFEHDEELVQGSGFYINSIGLITSYHVTQNEGFFKVYTYLTYPDIFLGVISKSLNEISSDEDIDYALYKPPFIVDNSHLFILGDSSKLKIGDQVITAGYPNHQKGNSPYIQTCSITSKKNFQGALFYTISGRISHGASGGVVLNENLEVIGIIKGGIVTLADDALDENQGFVPIHLVLEHLETQNGVS